MNAPSRRDRLRPLEFLLIAGVLALFAGLIVLVTTREPIFAIVVFGIAFIVTLVTIALLELAMKPDAAEKLDLHDQDEDGTKKAAH
jgi:Na+/melibiose symporter-like transporter